MCTTHKSLIYTKCLYYNINTPLPIAQRNIYYIHIYYHKY